MLVLLLVAENILCADLQVAGNFETETTSVNVTGKQNTIDPLVEDKNENQRLKEILNLYNLPYIEEPITVNDESDNVIQDDNKRCKVGATISTQDVVKNISDVEVGHKSADTKTQLQGGKNESKTLTLKDIHKNNYCAQRVNANGSKFFLSMEGNEFIENEELSVNNIKITN